MTADAETRAEVLAEIRQVLALLKEQAANPLARLDAPVPNVCSVAWDTPPTPTPEADLLKAVQAFNDAGQHITMPEAFTAVYTGPTPAVLQLLERLTYLLGLSDLERQFFEACASDEMADAFDGRLAYADWLEERGDSAGAVRVRKLTPRTGDVLVHYAPPSTSTQEALELHVVPARALAEALAARGVETIFAVIPPGGSLARLPEEQMVSAGWVPAGRVAEEREACAVVAERHGDRWIAGLIRNHGANPA